MKPRLFIAALALLASATLPAAAQGTDHKAAVIDALSASRTDEALSQLADWEKSETAKTDRFALLYYRGAAFQQRGMAASGSARDAAFASAREAYTQALALGNNDRIHANLALLESTAGNMDAASAAYERAVQRGGAAGAVHAVNYARHLQSIGRSADALRWAQQAQEWAPASAAARDLVVQLLRAQPGSAGLARHLAQEVAAGRAIFAARTALSTLREGGGGSAEERWTLLRIATSAMARDPLLARDEGVPKALAEDLQALAADAQLGAAARQLATQLATPRPSREAWSEWTGRPQRNSLRALATARAQAATDAARAERWWRLAIDLGETGPDPEAFVGLISHLAAQERFDALAPLMQRYEMELFSEKSEAYRSGDWTHIFRMHLALGMAYGHLKVWRSPSPFQNATFQLESAMRAAERANRETRPDRRPREPLALPAQGLALLAEAHAASGTPQRGTQLQLQGAEQLVQLKRPAEAALVVDKLNTGQLRAAGGDAEQRYERLRQATRAVP